MNLKKLVIGLLLGVGAFGASAIECMTTIQWCKEKAKEEGLKALPGQVHEKYRDRAVNGESCFSFRWHGANISSAPVSAAINTVFDHFTGRNSDKTIAQKFCFNMVYIPLSAAINKPIDTLKDMAIKALFVRGGIDCDTKKGKSLVVILDFAWMFKVKPFLVSSRLEPYLQRKSWNIVNRVTDSTQNNSQQSGVQDSLETQNRPFVIHASNQAV